MAEEPVTAAQVAQQLGVHVTTARFHLRNLVDDGKAASVVVQGVGPRVETYFDPADGRDGLVVIGLADLDAAAVSTHLTG